MKMSELRLLIIERSAGTCEWPKCYNAGKEAAHAHSRGMGGNRDARDVLENLSWLCDMHARFSDGELSGYGCDAYRKAHLDLLGSRFLDMPAHFVAYERAEELTNRAKMAVQGGNDE
jgi:hypothetical protein